MIRPDTLFLALAILWVASEFWIGRKRAADRGKAHDRGSLQVLHVAIWGSVFAAVWLSRAGIGRFGDDLRMPLFWAGCGMMIAGMGFRWWAIRVLDRAAAWIADHGDEAPALTRLVREASDDMRRALANQAFDRS